MTNALHIILNHQLKRFLFFIFITSAVFLVGQQIFSNSVYALGYTTPIEISPEPPSVPPSTTITLPGGGSQELWIEPASPGEHKFTISVCKSSGVCVYHSAEGKIGLSDETLSRIESRIGSGSTSVSGSSGDADGAAGAGSSTGFPTVSEVESAGSSVTSTNEQPSTSANGRVEDQPLAFRIPNVLGFDNAADILNLLLSLVFFLAGLFFFVNLVLGGLQWIFAGGDAKALDSARGRISHAFIGLLIVVSAFAVALIIETVLGIQIVSGFCIPTPSGACP